MTTENYSNAEDLLKNKPKATRHAKHSRKTTKKSAKKVAKNLNMC